MTRQQVSDNFGGQRLQTQARVIAQTNTTQQAPDMSGWRGLGEAFAAGDMLVEKNAAYMKDQDETRAASYANSMTVAELGKRIKEDKMLASESPVFAATVQHIWGQNSHDALQREVMSKVTTGELKFGSPEEVDTYLTEGRNTALSGASKYATAGFDKGYASLREKLMDSVAKVNDGKIVEQATMQASDSLSNTLLKVTGLEFKGTPAEAATALLEQYQLLRHTKVLPDKASKAALEEVVTRAATSGKTALLESLLNNELPDLGTVRSFLGETKAATLTNQATTRYDQGQRQRIDDEVLPFMQASDTGSLDVPKFMEWAQHPDNKKYTTAATIHAITHANMSALARQQAGLEKSAMQGAVIRSEYEAKKRVDAALTKGTLWEAQGNNTPQVLTTTGDVKDFDVKKYAEDALTMKTQGLPFDQQVSAWAMNGVKNPSWEKQLQAGLLNLSSISVDAKGKPTGQLNEAGTKAIELFRQLDAVNPDAARQTAGETEYKRFSDIAFLMHLGRDPSDAASIASNAAQGGTLGGPGDAMAKKVASAVGDLTGTPWADWFANRWGNVQDFGSTLKRLAPVVNPLEKARGVRSLVQGEFAEGARLLLFGGAVGPAEPGHVMRNSLANTSQVHGMVQRYATLLAHSGQVGDAETALKMAVSYISRPEVTAQVNGTLYLKSEMPAAPSNTRTPAEWLEKFIDAVPKARAKELGFPGESVRLEYDDRSRSYRAFVAGVPLTNPEGGLMVWQRGAIQQWYSTQDQIDLVKAASEASDKQVDGLHAAYLKRIGKEQGDLQTADTFVMERYDSSAGKQIATARLFSKEAFRRITRDGNQDKPLSELMKLYPATSRK